MKTKWNDIAEILSFKTFYVVLILFMTGILLLILDWKLTDAEGHRLFQGLLSSFAITLITSATISLIYEIYLRLDVVDFISEKITTSISRGITGPLDVVAFDKNRSSIDFSIEWRKSNSFYKIIGFSSNDILSPSNTPLILDKFRNDNNFHVKVLLLNPWSIMAKRRAEENIYCFDCDFDNRGMSIFRELKSISHSLNEMNIEANRFQVRLSDKIPSLSMCISGNEAIITPVLSTKSGGTSPSFRVTKTHLNDSLYDTYMSHFDYVWEDATDALGKSWEDIFEITRVSDRERLDESPKTLESWYHKVFN